MVVRRIMHGFEALAVGTTVWWVTEDGEIRSGTVLGPADPAHANILKYLIKGRTGEKFKRWHTELELVPDDLIPRAEYMIDDFNTRIARVQKALDYAKQCRIARAYSRPSNRTGKP